MRKTITFALLAAGLAGATQANAISRYNAMTMTCTEANAAADREGAVILRYPSQKVRGMTLYERAVRDSGQCDNREYAETRFITTSDTGRCAIRACAPASFDDDFWLMR